MNDHSGMFGNDFEPLDGVEKRTRSQNRRKRNRRAWNTRGWSIKNPFQNRTGLWWVDFICASLTVLGVISIVCNFENVCLGILNVICGLMSVLGVIMIIVVILLCIVFAIRSRRRRYWW